MQQQMRMLRSRLVLPHFGLRKCRVSLIYGESSGAIMCCNLNCAVGFAVLLQDISLEHICWVVNII